MSGAGSRAAAVAEGIHRIPLPTPFAVGRVNVYLLEGPPLTLIDTGPNSGRALDELEQGLAELGRSLADLELLVLTHAHVDHFGLAEVIRRRSGAEVAASETARPYLEGSPADAQADDDFAVDLMRRHGLNAEAAMALRSMNGAFRGWGARTGVDRVLRDGDRLRIGHREFEVHGRPGHSPSDTVFFDPERGLLVGGDHLLKDISSNPLLTRARHGGPRDQALVVYLDSLRRTREMEIDTVLPGHGEEVTEHRALIDSRLALHERRAAKLDRLIGERPRTAHELARALWGDVALTQAYLTLSEVLGHTDLLNNAGRVRETEQGGIVRFEPATGRAADEGSSAVVTGNKAAMETA